jgi:integrase
VVKHAVPKLGRLQVSAIIKADIAKLVEQIAVESASTANQVLAALSAVFSWAVKRDLLKVNPCHGVEREKLKARSRILHDSEFPLFWTAFDSAGVEGAALKVMLLTGQRPGEVCHMSRQHIRDNWWKMPGLPVPELAWPGTKNDQDHDVWLSEPVRKIIAELDWWR